MSKRHVPTAPIEKKIFLLRGHKVMLDRDLALLYGVKTGVLNQAVRRNRSRFPGDFMFQLSEDEVSDWMSQIVISNRERMGLRKKPLAFTEQGVAMLSGVLRSPRAVHVNIAIMRAFVKLRETLALHRDLARKLDELEKKVEGHDKHIHSLFEAIRQLMSVPPTESKAIGFKG